MLGSLALGLAATLVPALGPDRVAFGISIAVIGVTYQALLAPRVPADPEGPPGRGRPPTSCVCLVFPLFVHQSFLPAVIVAVGVIAQTTLTSGRRLAVGSAPRSPRSASPPSA